jgi:hypothetical protein
VCSALAWGDSHRTGNLGHDSGVDVEVGTRLIEQEHRLVRVIQNFANRRAWKADDPRRRAAQAT